MARKGNEYVDNHRPFDDSFINVRACSDDGASGCFEIGVPYMWIIEEFNYVNDFFRYTVLAPNYYSEEEESLSVFLTKNHPLHKHDFFEIIYVLKGNCLQKIENQEYLYHAGQCCILSYGVRHVEIPTEDTELFFLLLSENFLENLIKNDVLFGIKGVKRKNKNPLYELFSNQKYREKRKKQYWDFYPLMPANLIVKELERLFSDLIIENKKMEAGSYLMIQATVAKIFSFMLDSKNYAIRKTVPEMTVNEMLFSRIHRILEECNGRISRVELAERMNYNDHYLNLIVKRASGRSLHEYGKMLMLKEVARLLVETNLSISSITKQLEITNRTSLYQDFKKQYGETPNEYRKHMRMFL